jgi:hypothetical protein
MYTNSLRQKVGGSSTVVVPKTSSIISFVRLGLGDSLRFRRATMYTYCRRQTKKVIGMISATEIQNALPAL